MKQTAESVFWVGPIYKLRYSFDIRIKIMESPNPSLQTEGDSDEERSKMREAFDAIRTNKIDELKNLLEHVKVNTVDKNNKHNTLLHFAVEKGRAEIVQLLLDPEYKVKVNIDATNEVGNTPLHIAVLKNNAELVILLTDKGANSDIDNNEGEDPIDLARGSGVIEILKSANGTSRRDAAISKSDAKNEDEPSERAIAYEKRGGTCGLRGDLYGIKLAMLYLLHGTTGFKEKTVRGFRLRPNVRALDRIGKFRFECRYKDPNGAEKSKITFVQTKHKENVEKKAESHPEAEEQPPVAKKKDGWFLRDHFCAYLKVRDEFSKGEKVDPIFEGRFEDCEFVIFTNIPFSDYSKGYDGDKTEEAVERQSILEIEGQNWYYRLTMGGNKDDEIVAMVNSSLLSEKKSPSSTNSVSKDEIDKYFRKLKIFCSQRNESQLRDIIKNKIQSVYNLSSKDANQVFAVVEYQMRHWWIHEDKYLSQENRFFQDAARVCVRFGVKRPVVLFTGRDRQLCELHRSLQRNQSRNDVKSRTTCVAGLGGIGKTQLVSKYVEVYGGAYDDNVIWMNAESDGSLRREFMSLAQDKLKIATKNDHQNEKDISTIVDETYSYFAKKKSLFVFDNADETENLEVFLPLRLKPNAKRPYFLITSRRNEWSEGEEVIILEEFTETEAASFVRGKLELDEKDGAMNRSIKKLVKVLQRFPLAIQQAVSYIANRSLPVYVSMDEYLQTYERRTQDLLDWKPETTDTASEYEKTTYTTWEITIEKIRETPTGKLALEILDVIANIGSKYIKRTMFSMLAPGNDRELREAVRQLVKFSMITGKETQSILHVHELVQQVTRLGQIMRGTEAKIFQTTFRVLDQTTTDLLLLWAMDIWTHWDVFLLHFHGALKIRRENPNLRVFNLEDDDVVSVLCRCSPRLFYSKNARCLMESIEWMLKFEEERHGCDNFRLISILECLGTGYIVLNEFEKAKTPFDRILEIRERQHGHNHLAIVPTLVTIGDICAALEDHQKRKEFIKRALDIVEKQDACNYGEITLLLYKLAFAYGDLCDDQKRDELIDCALAIVEKHQPNDVYRLLKPAPMTVSYDDRPVCRGRSKTLVIFTSWHIMESSYFRDHPLSGFDYSSLENYEPQKGLLACSAIGITDFFGPHHFGVYYKVIATDIDNKLVITDGPFPLSDISRNERFFPLPHRLVIAYGNLGGQLKHGDLNVGFMFP